MHFEDPKFVKGWVAGVTVTAIISIIINLIMRILL